MRLGRSELVLATRTGYSIWRAPPLPQVSLGMPVVKCPIVGCPYETADVDAILAAALIITLATVHSRDATASAVATKTEKVKRPTISSAGTSEDWSYFQSRWGDYVKATKVTGTDKVVQLLECCDEQLRKDLTRTRHAHWKNGRGGPRSY